MLPIGLVIVGAVLVAGIVCWMVWSGRSSSGRDLSPKESANQLPEPSSALTTGSKHERPSDHEQRQAESGGTERGTTQSQPRKEQPKPLATLSSKDQAADRTVRSKPKPNPIGPSTARPQTAEEQDLTVSEDGQRDLTRSSRESGNANVSPKTAESTQDRSETASTQNLAKIHPHKVPRQESEPQEVVEANASRSKDGDSTTESNCTITARTEEETQTRCEGITEAGATSESVQPDVVNITAGENDEDAAGLIDPVLEATLGTASSTAVAPTAEPEIEPCDIADEIPAAPSTTGGPRTAAEELAKATNGEIEAEGSSQNQPPDQPDNDPGLSPSADPVNSRTDTPYGPGDAPRAGQVGNETAPPKTPQSSIVIVPPQTDQTIESPPKDAKRATKKRTASKYQPTARTAEATRRRNRPARAESENSDRETNRARTLKMSVHILFGRRKRFEVSLLPQRKLEMPESITVSGPDGDQTWDAFDDEWYCDVFPSDLGAALKDGCIWKLADAAEDLAWKFSGRNICVLARLDSTISGYVSVPRLMLREEHLVLCMDDELDIVKDALLQSGCEISTPISGTSVPRGWHLFSNVSPTIAVQHDDDGILNVLRPIDDVQIVLRHGIRLSHSKWLQGHPPQIRIRGRSSSDLSVSIDGEPADVDDSGNCTAVGWDADGRHTVFCGGVTQNYELIEGLETWKRFDPFRFLPAQGRAPRREFVICGPTVDVDGETENAFLTPSTNSCLLGAIPGQVAWSASPYGSRSREHLAHADFPVVWTVPSDPLRCDKSTACIRLIREEHIENSHDVPVGTMRDDVLRWSLVILNASRKHLPLEPDSGEAQSQWIQYKKVARRLWRQLR